MEVNGSFCFAETFKTVLTLIFGIDRLAEASSANVHVGRFPKKEAWLIIFSWAYLIFIILWQEKKNTEQNNLLTVLAMDSFVADLAVTWIMADVIATNSSILAGITVA